MQGGAARNLLWRGQNRESGETEVPQRGPGQSPSGDLGAKPQKLKNEFIHVYTNK